ncbi:hypothetical protein ACVXG9_02995 [Escherichia coli]
MKEAFAGRPAEADGERIFCQVAGNFNYYLCDYRKKTNGTT